MTTKNSSEAQLRPQAQAVARHVKAIAIAPLERLPEKLRLARGNNMMQIGMAMDDKTIIIEMPWDKIRNSTELSLVEYILKLMREEPTS